MRARVLLNLPFAGKMYKPDDIIVLPATVSADLKAELSARARQGVVRILEDEPPVETRDMHPAPAQRGYRKRA